MRSTSPPPSATHTEPASATTSLASPSISSGSPITSMVPGLISNSSLCFVVDIHECPHGLLVHGQVHIGIAERKSHFAPAFRSQPAKRAVPGRDPHVSQSGSQIGVLTGLDGEQRAGIGGIGGAGPENAALRLVQNPYLVAVNGDVRPREVPENALGGVRCRTYRRSRSRRRPPSVSHPWPLCPR